MERPGVGRNDPCPCPCGSGRKYKKCCLARGAAYPAVGVARGAAFGPPPCPAFRRAAPPPRATAFDDDPADRTYVGPAPPPVEAVPLLPVEVGLAYTYPEPFGDADVTFVFPAGKTFLLAGDEPVLVEDLEAGDRVLLKEGQVATTTDVRLLYDPPQPPVQQQDGRVLSRVIGTIRHKGPAVLDVSWPGFTATNSPDTRTTRSAARGTSRPRNCRSASTC